MLSNLLRRQARLALLPHVSSSLSRHLQRPAVATIQRAFSLSRVYFQEEPLPAVDRQNPSEDYKETSVEPTVEASTSLNPESSAVLWLANLHFRARAEEVLELFSTYGTVKAIHFPRNDQGLRNGKAYVEFSTPAEATRVFESAQEEPFILKERLVRIEFAKRPPRAWIANHEEIRPNNTIHIANYPYPGNDASLLAFMHNFSNNITKVHFMKDLNGRPTGKTFITFRDVETAHKALLSFQGQELGGTKLLLFYAHHRDGFRNPRPQRPRGPTVFDA